MTVTPPEPLPREALPVRLYPVLRDLGALILLLAGIGGLLFVGFTVSFEAGVAVLSLLSIAVGLVLAYRDPDDESRRGRYR